MLIEKDSSLASLVGGTKRQKKFHGDGTCRNKMHSSTVVECR